MTLASTLGKYGGIIAAETLWVFETGFKTGITYYITETSIQQISKIAANHVINSDDAETVTENIFECLEFID
jgi:hypothetical protein